MLLGTLEAQYIFEIWEEHKGNRMPNKLLFQTLQNSELPAWDKVQVILDLAEQKNNEVYPIILKLIDQPEFNNCKGTLVYALENYPPEPLFEKAIEWLIHGEFEVAYGAFNIINKISKLSGDSVDDAYESIGFASKDRKNEEWRTELLNEALDMFE